MHSEVVMVAGVGLFLFGAEWLAEAARAVWGALW
jgi:Sec-independent protein translocase protein TatA